MESRISPAQANSQNTAVQGRPGHEGGLERAHDQHRKREKRNKDEQPDHIGEHDPPAGITDGCGRQAATRQGQGDKEPPKQR